MVAASVVVLEYVCPALGVVTGNIMFAAPVRDCYQAVCAGKGLGPLNPKPWAFMLGNTVGWIAYGYLIQNVFVVLGNAPGLLMSIWLNLQAVKMQYEVFRSNATRSVTAEEQDGTGNDTNALIADGCVANQGEEIVCQGQDAVTDLGTLGGRASNKPTNTLDIPPQRLIPPIEHDILVLANAGLWLVVFTVVAFATALSPETKELIVGFVVNSILVVFYGSPLSDIWEVFRSRNSATIHIPTMLTNTFNGAFWAAYGLAVQNWFIAVPNLLGAALGGIQALLCLVFPRNVTDENVMSDSLHSEADSIPPAATKDEPVADDLGSSGMP